MKIGILANWKNWVPGAWSCGKKKIWMEALTDWFCQEGRVRYRENSFGSWKCLSL